MYANQPMVTRIILDTRSEMPSYQEVLEKQLDNLSHITGLQNVTQGKPMKEQIIPARDWVLLELEESKYAGALIIPETAKDAPSIATVVAVGPGTPGESYNFDDFGVPIPIPLLTKVGDKVLFAKYSGADIEWEGKKRLLVRESEIIAYIKEVSE